MLKRLVRRLLKGGLRGESAAGPERSDDRRLDPASVDAGAVVFVLDVPEPVRLNPGDRPYSDLASLRLRTFPAALGLAKTRTVVFAPPRVFADPKALEALEPVDALVISKFSTADLLAKPAQFESLLDFVSRSRGRIRAFADLSDNYAAIGEAIGQSWLARYQKALLDRCVLTVPCDALLQELEGDARLGVHVIEDAYESPAPREPRTGYGDPLRLCWFGALGDTNLDTVRDGLVAAAGGLGGRTAVLALVTHESRRALADELARSIAGRHSNVTAEFVPWSPEATWRAIDACDLVVLPQDAVGRWGRVKSHNRLVEAIRGGRLAVASPIPAYRELAGHAWVGEDLGAGVAWALANPEDAAARVRAGRATIERRFAPGVVGEKWVRLLAT